MGTMSVASLGDSSQRQLAAVEERRWSMQPDVEATSLPDSPCDGARLKVPERVTEEVKVDHPVSAAHRPTRAHPVTPILPSLHKEYQLVS